MQIFESSMNGFNSIIWSMALVVLCLGTGIWFSVRMRFPQVRLFKDMIKLLVSGEKSESGITPFQAFAATVGSRVGMEDINLHFTGDFHTIGAANNLLAAMLDNHIQQGNKLGIDVKQITWKRAVDMNDRQLRNIVNGLGGRMQGVPREDGFEITVASEVMAVLCLASDIKDLKERLGRMIVAYTYEGKPVTAHDLKAEGAMAALLKDALKPNLVQTLEHTPAFIHGGPFANIAHGCNSVTATRMALKLGDYVVTEAGFAADLGAEKFIDIKCRLANLHPSAVVIVATVRALKYHGGVAKADLNNENLDALEKGLPNLLQHVSNVKNVFGLPCVVAINAFPTDTDAELALVEKKCKELGVNVSLSEVWAKGGEGGAALAREVVRLCEEENSFSQSYDVNLSIEEKLETICKRIYHADGVQLVGNAVKQVKQLTELGFDKLPICMAKTQYSFSDDASLLGAPKGFTITVRNLKVAAGAGFRKIFAIWFPVMLLVFSGYEHSVANMTYIPLGMFLGAEVTVGQFILGNLLPVTIGNLIGGAVIIPLLYRAAYLDNAAH